MATHSSVLAWRIPGTGEPGGLPSMGSPRVRHDWSDLAVAVAGSYNELFLNQSDNLILLFGIFSPFIFRCVRAQACLTLCDSMDCSPTSSSVHGTFQARILEWVAMPSSRGSSQPRDWTHISCVSCIGRWILYLCATWEAPFIFTELTNIFSFISLILFAFNLVCFTFSFLFLAFYRTISIILLSSYLFVNFAFIF